MLDLNVPGYQSHLQLLLQRCHPACVVPYKCNVKEGPQAGAVQCVRNSLYNTCKSEIGQMDVVVALYYLSRKAQRRFTSDEHHVF